VGAKTVQSLGIRNTHMEGFRKVKANAKGVDLVISCLQKLKAGEDDKLILSFELFMGKAG